MERGDEGSAVFIRDRLRSVDLGGGKGAGISIRVLIGMICMIRRWATRLTVGGPPRITRAVCTGPYHPLITTPCLIGGVDLDRDWLIPLSESVIWRRLDAAQRHPRRVHINALPPANAPPPTCSLIPITQLRQPVTHFFSKPLSTSKTLPSIKMTGGKSGGKASGSKNAQS